MLEVTNSVAQYFKEISSLKALTREEERGLWEVIQKGRKKIVSAIKKGTLHRIREILEETLDSELDPFDQEERDSLTAAIEARKPDLESIRKILLIADFDVLVRFSEGDDRLMEIIKEISLSRNKLIESNMKWAVSIAKTYAPFVTNMDLGDLIQEANIGLIKAVDKFDPNRGRLTTVVQWWAKQNVIRSISNKERQIRIPVHLIDVFNRAVRELSKNGKLPTDVEISNHLKLPNITPQKVQEIIALIGGPQSLNVMVSGDYASEDGFESGETNEILVEDERELADEQLGRSRSEAVILEEFRLLSPREEKAIRLFLGI